MGFNKNYFSNNRINDKLKETIKKLKKWRKKR